MEAKDANLEAKDADLKEKNDFIKVKIKFNYLGYYYFSIYNLNKKFKSKINKKNNSFYKFYINIEMLK